MNTTATLLPAAWPLLAQAEPAVLVSLLKPLLLVALFIPWGKLVARMDDDAAFFYLKRQLFNLVYLGCAMAALAAVLFIPIFWVGLPLAILLLAGPIIGYIYYRNPQVPDKEKFEFNLDGVRAFMLEKKQGGAQKRAGVKLLKLDETELPVPIGEDPNVAAHELFETLVEWCLPRKAEEISVGIAGDDEEARVVARVDGMAFDRKTMALEPIPKAAGYQLFKYLQESAQLDTSEKRKKQTGQFKIAAEVVNPVSNEAQTERHLVELKTAGSSRTMQLTMEFDPDQRAHRPVSQLGLIPKQAEQIKASIAERGGVVLVAAPAKSGVSTMTYALVNEHDPYVSSVLTLEQDMVLQLEGVKHIPFDANGASADYEKQLAGMLRTDPQVMLLDRTDDTDAMRLVAKAAEEIRFYLPYRADSALEAINQYLAVVGEPKLAAASLTGVVAGRLLRKLCSTCRTAYTPEPAALKKMNLAADKITELYRSSGQVVDSKGKPMPCPDCRGLGYRGRVGVFEVLMLDDEARKLIATGDQARLKAHLASLKFIPLQRAALAKVRDGVTDVAEVQRVLGGGKSRKRTKA